jgi:hypothetical protein
VVVPPVLVCVAVVVAGVVVVICDDVVDAGVVPLLVEVRPALVLETEHSGVPHGPAEVKGTNLHLWHCQPGQQTSHTPPIEVHWSAVGLAHALGSTRS